MATRITALNRTNATDADFRAWINEIHNALIAFGWVQTADTGQINYATVLHPTTSGANMGYAIYRMNDSLQSACPVYIKLEYGSTTQTNEPGIRITIAIGGSDGAGTLTGIKTGVLYLNNNNGATGVSNMLTAGTSSSFRYTWGWASASTLTAIAIERDVDASGNETSNGVQILQGNGAGSFSSIFLDNVAQAVAPTESRWYGLLSAQASQSVGGNTGVSPVRCVYGQFRNAMKTLMLFAKADYTDQSTQSITHYGASHTYRMICPASNTNINGLNAACGFAFLWE
jgi:hypothetical protein